MMAGMDMQIQIMLPTFIEVPAGYILSLGRCALRLKVTLWFTIVCILVGYYMPMTETTKEIVLLWAFFKSREAYYLS